MRDWIVEGISKYKKVYELYIENEPALGGYAFSMVRILNDLSEMKYTQFHRYEKAMLWRVMEVFSKQCIEQIYQAHNCVDVEEKKAIMIDIEESISEITDVYKNIMDGTANTERQMFQSLSMNTNMYELSPKLCSFYAAILEKVIKMFNDGEGEYAFVLHPTVRSTIEAKVLLKKRQESGKAVIVYVSESLIEQFNLVPICLLHEAFHVITKKERNRKARAGHYLMLMIECIKGFMFEGVEFSLNKEEDSEIKDSLINYWFGDIRDKFPAWKDYGAYDKFFYGENISQQVMNVMHTYLSRICMDLNESVKRIACDCGSEMDFRGFKEKIEKASIMSDKIRENILRIIAGRKIKVVSDLVLFMFRETYADVACILTLELTPDAYRNAFLDSIQFQYDENSYYDANRHLRERLVAEVVSRYISIPLQTEWRQYAEKLKEEEARAAERDSTLVEKRERLNRQSTQGCVMIPIDDYIVNRLNEYLKKCGEEFSRRLQDIWDIQSFREEMKRIISGDMNDLLPDILVGNIFDLLP